MKITNYDPNKKLIKCNLIHDNVRMTLSILCEIAYGISNHDYEIQQATKFNKKRIGNIAIKLRKIIEENNIDL